ncbi:hypothetical protein [Bacillus pseudomycoides]|uniref:hypothetical protein n=1 Tax=Bacillus pseudomycoides TaxID=64104 RepID=UPI002B4A775F|nr:hypothetical protein [Bacillus pseudomycoides]MEB3057363.1 hypothetical protein [Bacillus pseudomycoides]
MEEYGIDQFVGIVKNGEFQILIPESARCTSVKLTGIREMEAVTPEAREINLTSYENRALVVQGHHGGEWIYAAHVAEQAGPAFTAVVQQLAGLACES